MKVLKYNINKEGVNKIFLPLGAKVLDIQSKNEELVLWCNVNPEIEDIEDRIFEVDRTDQEVPFRSGIKREYVSTVQFNNGDEVHVFEILTD